MVDVQLTKETIEINNTKIYCEHTLNDRPPLFLIHGFLASTYTFNRVIPLLAEDFSIVAFDLPGFGNSEKSTSFDYSFEGYAQMVNDLMDHFQLNKVSIAGHSMGGQVALYTARNFPDRVDKLILLNSSGYLMKPAQKYVAASYLPFFSLFLMRYFKRVGVEKTLQNVLYDQSLINQEMIRVYEKPFLKRDFYRSLIRLIRQREGDLFSEKLSSIKHPILLLWGKNDKITPLRIGKKLAGDLPNATLKAYDQTGHLITDERPNEIVDEMKHFLLE
ncbi:alpha/beta fold hydrolase [Allobacillus sp. GCM10007491]|uniref:Alpha/beta hydrolase n=1 Tax=Allobacillus saliphilus TaxID=2912308 RepID=A0A941HSA2_9BACI|nr:alpha/beta hydrolase [Allobacillus saliphilus]MBR7553466.1 alpha/beta hydrolase [Allobacillus saliphilus]